MKGRKDRILDGCDFVWDEEAFPNPKGFIEWLAERGVKLSLWENPYVYRGSDMFQEGLQHGYFVRGPDGEPAPSLENRDAVLVDFTNPRAYRWWQRKHLESLRMGVPVFKTDYGEAVPEDAVFHDGRTGVQMHNLYPLLYNRAVFEVIQREVGEAVVFARSGYAGSQRYPFNWMGDSQCTWTACGAPARASPGLSASF
jgi:alpha-D-xyloside xylohydrolase